ncbi:MAG: hypothetical protein HZA34_00400 [Candidatus Pacebacteria bacterium]|nr:hypothetical protein [Candidatus Paceibacterota bacterium]
MFLSRRPQESYPSSEFIELDLTKQEKLKKFRESHPRFNTLVESGLELIGEEKANETQSRYIREFLWKLAVVVSMQESRETITRDHMKAIGDIIVQRINVAFPDFARQANEYMTDIKLFDHLLNGRT